MDATALEDTETIVGHMAKIYDLTVPQQDQLRKALLHAITAPPLSSATVRRLVTALVTTCPADTRRRIVQEIGYNAWWELIALLPPDLHAAEAAWLQEQR